MTPINYRRAVKPAHIQGIWQQTHLMPQGNSGEQINYFGLPHTETHSTMSRYKGDMRAIMYWIGTLRRALRDTFNVLEWSLPTISIAALSGVLSLYHSAASKNWLAVFTQLSEFWDATVHVGIWVFVAVFTFNVLLAPAKLAAEDKTKIADLIAKLDSEAKAVREAENKRRLMHFITELLDRGLVLLNERIAEDDLAGWLARVERWDRVTNYLLRNDVSAQAALQFELYQRLPFPRMRFRDALDGEHIDRLQKLDSQVQHLQKYLHENSQFHAPLHPELHEEIRKRLAKVESELFASDGNEALNKGDGSKPASSDLTV